MNRSLLFVGVALGALSFAACMAEPEPIVCPPDPPDRVQMDFDALGADGADARAVAEAWPGEVELASAEGLAAVRTPARRGTGAARFRLSAGDAVNSGTRAELSFDARDGEGERAHYAWSLRLAEDWPTVTPLRDEEGRPNWQIVAQFHDQPDCSLGQTWDSYPGAGASPPIALELYHFASDDPDVIEAMETGVTDGILGFGPDSLDRSLLGLLVGAPTTELAAVVPIEPGTWVDLGLSVTWSQGGTGRVEWWVDGELIGSFDGPNMLNAAPHYFKVGLYRNPSIEPAQTLFVDEVLVTDDDADMEAFRAALSEAPRDR